MPGYFDDDEHAPSLSDQGYDDEPDQGQPSRPPLPLTRGQLAEQAESYEVDVSEPQQMEAVDINAEEVEEDYQEVVSHVDRRLRIAQWYRTILDGSLFNDDTAESKIVQNRIRKFVRDEIEILFGMKAAPVQAAAGQFSPDEVEALKALAAATMVAKRAAPKLNRVSQPPPPQAPAPALRPAQTPSQQVQVRQAAPRVVAPQQRPAAPKPKPQQRPAAPPAQPGTLQSNVKAGDPSLITDPRVPEEWRNDPTLRVKNGHVYVQQRNPDGELLWVNETGMQKPMPLLKDITPVAKPNPSSPNQPIPMPSVESMTMLTEQMAAQDNVRNLERLAIKLDPVFRGGVGSLF